MSNKEIKKISKTLIRHRIIKSFSVLILSIFIIAFFAVIPYFIMKLNDIFEIDILLSSFNRYVFPAVLSLILIALSFWALCSYSSVQIGEKAWYSGANKKSLQSRRLFFWFRFSKSFKAFRLQLLLFLFKSFWFLAFLSPCLLAFSAVYMLASTGGIELYLFISLVSGGAILMIIGLFFAFIASQRYFIAPYLLAENPTLGAYQSIKQSKNLLEGHTFRIVKFKLSFIPWFMLCPLIFPIIYIYPYYKQSCCVIAKEIRL